MLYSGDFRIKDKTTRFHQKKMLPKLKTWNYNIWLSQYSLLSFSVCNVKLKLSFSMKWKRLKFHQWTVAYLLNLCPISHQSGLQLSWFRTWPETQERRYFFLQLYWHTKEFAVKEALCAWSRSSLSDAICDVQKIITAFVYAYQPSGWSR